MTSGRKTSVASIATRIALGLDEEPNYEEMSDEALQGLLETSIRTNRLLTLENIVFERYLKRHDPQALVTMTQVLEAASQIQRSVSQMIPATSVQNITGSVGFNSIRERNQMSPSTITTTQTHSGSRRHGSVLAPQSRSVRITVNHRIEMASKEIEEMKRHLVILEEETIKRKANLRAQMEEIQMRIREIQEATAELEENVVKRGVDALTGKISAEKLIRFMEDWIKAADRIVEKLRLKSLSLKQQIQKSKIQMKQRAELGETLHPIDFQVLAIENQDYLKKIEEKNLDLTELKRLTGRYNLKLSNQKEKLQKQQKILKDIKYDVELKRNQIEKLKIEEKNINEEIARTNEKIDDIKTLTSEKRIPDALDFIKIQAELQEMKRTYKRLERHKQLQLNAVKTLKKQQKQLNELTFSKKSNSGLRKCPNTFLSTPSI